MDTPKQKMTASRRRPITSPDEKPVWVNIAEYAVSKDKDEVLIAYGVGSCVICCVYDRIVPVAGMIHVMLPVRNDMHRRETEDAGYADVGIPILIQAMRDSGALDTRMVVKLAGGANIVKSATQLDRDIGRRNLVETRRILKDIGLFTVFEDVGGTHWRTIRFYTGTGRLVVSAGGNTQKVCDVDSRRSHRLSKS
jgi:chemotaxis protein CheD